MVAEKNKKLNLLFVNPSSMPECEQRAFLDKTSVLRVPSFSMPLGLLDISAFLKEKIPAIKIKILDMGKDLYEHYLDREKKSPMTLESYLKFELAKVEFIPDVVGISMLFATSQKTSLITAKIIKEIWPDCLLVVGGNHATNIYKILLGFPYIDYVVRGEAEISFTRMLEQLLEGAVRVDVAGIYDKKKSEQSGSELGPMIQNLDEIPLPALDLLDIGFYRKTIGASLMFTRGCPFRCAFCASHTVHGRLIRYKSQERIFSEFESIIDKYNFKSVVIEDDLFASQKEKFINLAEKLSKKYKDVKFLLPQGLSVAVLNEEIIDAMIKMGIKEAAVAIESGSEYVQKKIIKKNVSLEKAKSILEYLRKKEFNIYVNFILGFPGETQQMMNETTDYINSIDVDWVYIFHALPLPGSEIYDILVSKKIIDPATFDWDGLRLGRRNFDTPEITAEKLARHIYDLNISRNFFDNDNLKQGRFEKAISIFDNLILSLYPYHVVGRYCRALCMLGMGEKDKANEEFKECVEWIKLNSESKRLFDNYGGRMPLLKKYL